MADHSIIVARARIADGKVHLEPEATSELTLKAGTRLDVQLLYHYLEDSDDQEHYRFRLAADLAGQRPDPAEVEWHDRPLLLEERKGYIAQRFHLDHVGTEQLHFRVQASYGVGPWGKGASERKESEVHVEGTIVVRIV